METFSLGLATLNSDVLDNESVIETKTLLYVKALKKFSEQLQMIKRIQAPEFIPHSIQSNAELKADKATAKREDFKELSKQFLEVRHENQLRLKEIMLKSRKLELQVRKVELRNITS